MAKDKNQYRYLPTSRAASLVGLPAASVRALISEGRVRSKGHAGVRYVYWPSLVEALDPQVVRILKLRKDLVPKQPLDLERRETLLYAAGYVPVPVAQHAAEMAKVTIYRWVRDGVIESVRVTKRYYVRWASLVKELGTISKILKLNPKKLPELPKREAKQQPQGPRVLPGSKVAKALRASGYISVREASNSTGFGEKTIRRWVALGRVTAERHGSSILVSKKSLDAYVEEAQ